MVLSESDTPSCDGASHSITVTNIKNGDTLCHPLCIVKGHVQLRSQPSACRWPEAKLHMRQYSGHDRRPIVTNWPVVNGEFKCMARLYNGNNHILLEFCGTTIEFVVVYQSTKTPYHVLPVYIICKDHDGQFQAPASEDNTIKSACRRIALGARLIQCLTAEKLKEAGFERKTFQLFQDLEPSSSECVVFQSQLNVEQARKMQGVELWEYFGRELMMSPLGKEDRKFLAFLSCTRYSPRSPMDIPKSHDDIVACTEAYVALGGGGLALFGTACLHTWASRIEEIIPRFLNQTRVDTQHFMDDSCYRGTYGGCFATTLGSVCHELGHTFDLGHSSEGIMGRGFDSMDLVFAVHSQNNNNNNSHLRRETRNVISPVCKELPQHSTIAFTKVLNVSYSVPSSTRHPIAHLRDTSVERNSNPRNSCSSPPVKSEDGINRNQSEPGNTEGVELRRVIEKSNGDCTYWSKSCAALLNSHKWFNAEETRSEENDVLKFCFSRDGVVSTKGICVAEVRDDSGLILHSWEFSEPADLLPQSVEWQTEGVQLLVVEDSVGNILKHPLV